MSGKPSGSRRKRKQEEANSSQTPAGFEEAINKCVRYLLYVSQANVPIKKADIIKNALPGLGKSYEPIMTEVGKNLEKVYGCQLVSFEEGTTKYHLLVNKTDYTDTEDCHDSADANKILTMLVLTHIFMSNNSVNEGSMDAFFASLGIDPNVKHRLFGNVKEFVNSALPKRMFVKVTADRVTRRSTYSWGPRAEATVSKKDILEFVCKVYGSRKDLQPREWENQFKDAQQQELIINREAE